MSWIDQAEHEDRERARLEGLIGGLQEQAKLLTGEAQKMNATLESLQAKIADVEARTTVIHNVNRWLLKDVVCPALGQIMPEGKDCDNHKG